MNRSIAKFPERLPELSEKNINRKKKVYEIQFITPLFGGGVEVGKVDPITPIHGTSIRGQLRFWWRATRGAQFETADELKRKEGEIWGTTDQKSPVSLAVEIVNKGNYKTIKELSALLTIGNKNDIDKLASIRYILFPFLEKKNQTAASNQFPTDIRFRLILKYPEKDKSDVEAAVWAWINFGGIGARTRRGCGALYCHGVSPTENVRIHEIHDWYQNNLKTYQISLDGTREWPTLPDRLLVKDQKKKPLQSWQDVVSILMQFRQGRGLGRKQGRGKFPGKSNWPEAEHIRELAGEKTAGGNSKDARVRDNREQGTSNFENYWFPRAELGMPIIFQRTLKNTLKQVEPELLPENKNRMASPLVLKPLALSAQQAVPIILKLTTSGPGNVELKKLPNKKSVLIKEKQIREVNLETVPNSPLQRFAAGSALEAFLKYAMSEEGGYK